MRYIILILSLLGLLLTACSDKNNTESSEDSKVAIKEVAIPEDICGIITKKTIFYYFNIDESAIELELKEEISKSNAQYSKCGYEWKKHNYEELNKIYTDYLIQSTMSGEVNISEISKLESPSNTVQIGAFRIAKNLDEAKTDFKNQHRIPTEEDMEVLRKEIDKNEEGNLSSEEKSIGKKLSENIASNLKFTPVEGIGDEAFYSHLDKSLDIRYDKMSFKVYIDTYLTMDENIEIAKKIAQEFLDSL